MKKSLKFGSVLLAGALTCGIALGTAGCNSGGIEIDPGRSQLYVFSYDGGVGNEWLDHAIESFEALYADESFEEGKKGVQVIPAEQKDAGTSMVDSFKNKNIDVVFNETMRYNEWVQKGNLKDISDIVTGANELDGGKKIVDKIPEDKRAALTANGGKYYGIPHYEAFRGVVYDIDLFEDNNLYFAKDNTFGDFVLDKTAAKSAGPDGREGTYDDGLPATYEQFWLLCDEMVEKGITPFIWTGDGMHPEYGDYLLFALSETMAGADEAKLNYSFGNGITDDAKKTAHIVKGFTGSESAGWTPTVETEVISEENGYLMRQTESKYRALEFLFKIFNNSKYYYSDSVGNLNMSNVAAQQEYIMSSLENHPIAMLIDGTFWETEAKNSIELSIEAYDDKAKNRNFGWMPLPGVYDGEVTEANGKKQVLSDYINSYCGISANCSGVRLEIAKLFVKYCYSDAGLNQFTEYTGMRRGVNYEITSEVKGKMSKFYKNLLTARENAEIITPMSASPLFMANENMFSLYNNVWNSKGHTFPINAFRAGDKGVKSAKTYFEGMALTAAEWANSKYTVS